MLTPDKRKHL